MAVSFTIPENIGNMSDAQIFRLARKVSENDTEIARIEADLKQIRADANKTKAEVKRTKAQVAGVTGSGTIGKKASIRVSDKGIGGSGVNVNGKGFSLGGGVMRGLGPAFYVFGAARAIGGIAQKWQEEEETRQLFGPGEVAGRASAAVARAIFGTFTGTFADALGPIITAMAGFLGPGYSESAAKMVEDIRNLPKGIRTRAETIERMSKALGKAAKFEVDELAYLDSYTPPNIVVGTSRELKNLREQLKTLNQSEISDAKKLIYESELAGMD